VPGSTNSRNVEAPHNAADDDDTIIMLCCVHVVVRRDGRRTRRPAGGFIICVPTNRQSRPTDPRAGRVYVCITILTPNPHPPVMIRVSACAVPAAEQSLDEPSTSDGESTDR
jgi:hypothetical protein